MRAVWSDVESDSKHTDAVPRTIRTTYAPTLHGNHAEFRRRECKKTEYALLIRYTRVGKLCEIISRTDMPAPQYLPVDIGKQAAAIDTPAARLFTLAEEHLCLPFYGGIDRAPQRLPSERQIDAFNVCA